MSLAEIGDWRRNSPLTFTKCFEAWTFLFLAPTSVSKKYKIVWVAVLVVDSCQFAWKPFQSFIICCWQNASRKFSGILHLASGYQENLACQTKVPATEGKPRTIKQEWEARQSLSQMPVDVGWKGNRISLADKVLCTVVVIFVWCVCEKNKEGMKTRNEWHSP